MPSNPPNLDFEKYLNLLKRKKRLFAVVSLAIMTVIVVLSYFLPKKYQAKSTVFIEKNVISELVKGIAVTPSMEETIKVLNYALTSRNLLMKVLGELDQTVNKSDAEIENLIATIQKNTDVSVKDRNLFTIAYRSSDPKLARDFVNTLVRRYIEENVSSKREESYGATQFLSGQIDVFREKLKKAEADVNEYKRANSGYIGIDEGRLFQEINTAQQKLYDLQLRRRHLEGLRPVARRSSDPMQANLFAMQKRLDELRVEFTDSYPEVVRVKSDIDALKEQMKRRPPGAATVDLQEVERADAEIAAIKVSEEGLKRYVSTNQALLRMIPTAKAGLEKLELEKNNSKNLYDQLVARHGQSEVSKQMEVQDKSTTFRVVDPAILPTKPISPKRVQIILAGIVLGLAGGMVALVLLDQMDRSVKGVEALKPLGFPVLAVIPRIENPKDVRVNRIRDLRLYFASGLYFSVILTVLVVEWARNLPARPGFLKYFMG